MINKRLKLVNGVLELEQEVFEALKLSLSLLKEKYLPLKEQERLAHKEYLDEEKSGRDREDVLHKLYMNYKEEGKEKELKIALEMRNQTRGKIESLFSKYNKLSKEAGKMHIYCWEIYSLIYELDYREFNKFLES